MSNRIHGNLSVDRLEAAHPAEVAGAPARHDSRPSLPTAPHAALPGGTTGSIRLEDLVLDGMSKSSIPPSLAMSEFLQRARAEVAASGGDELGQALLGLFDAVAREEEMRINAYLEARE